MTGLGTLQKTPRRLPVSVEMYHILGEQGAFEPEERLELLEGVIYEKSPIGSLHARCVNFLNDFLIRSFAGKYVVSVQAPITLDDMSEPEPDIAVLHFRGDFYKDVLPNAKNAVLVIEVADTSLDFDRKRKLPRYATAGVPEFWLIDLESERVEVHSDPKQGTYGLVKIFQRGETSVSETLPEFAIEVDKVLG